MILVSQNPPNPPQNPSKIEVPKNMRFFIDFCSKNALLQRLRHRFRIGFSNTFCLSDTFLQIAFRMHFGSKKPTKNRPKSRSEPFKNRFKKRCFFQHRFFHVLGSIWEGFGEPTWTQVGPFWPKKTMMGAHLSLLKIKVF